MCIHSLSELNGFIPSCLHLHHEFGILPLRELRNVIAYCRRHGTRLIVTMHTIYPVPPSLWPWPSKAAAYWADRRRLPLRAALEIVLGQRAIIAGADLIVTTTDAGRQALEQMGARWVRWVPLGLQIHPVSDRLLSDGDGRRHVGVFGHLVWYKRVLEIIDACEAVSNIVLHIFAGPNEVWSDDQYIRAVESRVAEADWVRLDRTYHDLSRIVWKLSQCDVNVWYQEPLPELLASGSIREYLAALRPVIAAETAALADLRGLVQLVDPYDTAALVAALQDPIESSPALHAYLEEHTFDRLRLDDAH